MNQTCPLDFLTYLIELQILIFMTGELQIRLNGEFNPRFPLDERHLPTPRS